MSEAFEKWFMKSRAIDYGCEPTNSQILNKIIEKKAYTAGMERAAEIVEEIEEGCGYGCPNIIAAAIRKEMGK